MRRHEPPTGVAPSTSELPFWASEKPALVLIEGAVSVHSDKGSQDTRRVTYRSQKWGRAALPQPTSEQEMESGAGAPVPWAMEAELARFPKA